jgi:hypothetical protein
MVSGVTVNSNLAEYCRIFFNGRSRTLECRDTGYRIQDTGKCRDTKCRDTGRKYARATLEDDCAK